jgi:hypothetical protein
VKRICILLLFGLAISAITAAQTEAAAAAVPEGLADLVHQQFGSCFEISTRSSELKVKYLHAEKEQAAFVPFVAGDVDGDGVEDAVIVAHCKNPLTDEADFGYRVIDPYFSAHGFGDPKITSQFNTSDPNAGDLLLVIHGVGPDGWRSKTPKAKFVVINLPFHTVMLGRYQRRKGTAPAIKLIEAESLSSVIYWDGKKYRWADVAGEN